MTAFPEVAVRGPRPALQAFATMAMILLLGCAPDAAGTATIAEVGPSKDEVCHRFLADGSSSSSSSSSTDRGAGGEAHPPTAPSAAQQHLRTAAQLADFAAFARRAEDPDLADSAKRLEQHARAVLTELSAAADDEETDRIVGSMFAESTALYYDCATHLLGPMQLPTELASGACAEADAPTLEGSTVVYYGSGDYDFIESRCELVRGVPIDGGCSFPGGSTLSGGPSDQVVATVEVAYDSENCTALHEIGTVHADDLP